MSTALPAGTQIFEWAGLTLHGLVSGWQDSRMRRIAQHQFDRRDGAQSEDMGRAPHTTRASLLFADADGIATLKKFVALWNANPTRLLVHPIFGRMNATFVGIESGELRVDGGANVYTVAGQFVESNLNADVVYENVQGVSSRAGQVDTQTALVGDLLDPYPAAATSITAYTAASAAFSVASVAAASTGAVDPSLSGLLATALAANDTAIAAIRAAVNDSPAAYDAVATCQVLAARLLDLGSAYLAQRPPLVEYVAGEPVHLLTLAARWYPGDAVARLSEIRAFNPALVGVIVPSGTKLLLASQ